MTPIKLPSRDTISMEMYGMKFSQLSLDRKKSVNSAITVLGNEARSGNNPETILQKLALQESFKIIKQLKEIQVNPGDPIKLPPGALDDAAKLVHYHYKAIGNKKPLSKGDIEGIRREVKKQFGNVNPEVVNCVAEYLSNPKGRFNGVGVKGLRVKLRSYLDADQINKLKDDEILSARDITIAKLYDNWMHGNLTTGIAPRIAEIAASTAKEAAKTVRPLVRKQKQIPIQEVNELVESLGFISDIQNGPSTGLQAKVFARSMSNLGISASQIVGFDSKELVANLRNAVYEHAIARDSGNRWQDKSWTKGVRTKYYVDPNDRKTRVSKRRGGNSYRSATVIRNKYSPKYRMDNRYASGVSGRAVHRGGGVFRRNWDIHKLRTSEQREALPSKNVHFGIGKSTGVTLTPWESSHRIAGPTTLDIRIPDMQEFDDQGVLIDDGSTDYNWAKNAETYDPEYDKWYGNVPRKAYTSRRFKYTPAKSYFLQDDLLIPERIIGGVPIPEDRNWNERAEQLWTGAIHQPIYSVTRNEADSPLSHRVNRMDEADQYAYKKAYFEYEQKYGAYYASRLLDLGVPEDKFLESMQFGKEAIAALFDEYSLAERFETDITDNPDKFSPFRTEMAMAGKYHTLTTKSPVFKAAAALLGLFEDENTPSLLKGMTDDVISDIAFKGGESGITAKRVGILGSDSWDDKSFIDGWLKANWNPDDLMISTTHIGKNDLGENVGASKFANDWAHWNKVALFKHAARNYPGANKGTAHVEDVFSNSDEVVAFFEQLYPNGSALKRIKQIGSYAKKHGIPVRIIYHPSNQAMQHDITDKEGFTMKDRLQQEYRDIPNIKVDFYKPRAYPEYGTTARGIGPDRPWKYLAKGGNLGAGETAVVGEQGPEIIENRGGTLRVHPNSSIRKLEDGTYGADAFNVIKDHIYREFWSVPRTKSRNSIPELNEYKRLDEIVKQYVSAAATAFPIDRYLKLGELYQKSGDNPKNMEPAYESDLVYRAYKDRFLDIVAGVYSHHRELKDSFESGGSSLLKLPFFEKDAKQSSSEILSEYYSKIRNLGLSKNLDSVFEHIEMGLIYLDDDDRLRHTIYTTKHHPDGGIQHLPTEIKHEADAIQSAIFGVFDPLSRSIIPKFNYDKFRMSNVSGMLKRYARGFSTLFTPETEETALALAETVGMPTFREFRGDRKGNDWMHFKPRMDMLASLRAGHMVFDDDDLPSFAEGDTGSDIKIPFDDEFKSAVSKYDEYIEKFHTLFDSTKLLGLILSRGYSPSYETDVGMKSPNDMQNKIDSGFIDADPAYQFMSMSPDVSSAFSGSKGPMIKARISPELLKHMGYISEKEFEFITSRNMAWEVKDILAGYTDNVHAVEPFFGSRGEWAFKRYSEVGNKARSANSPDAWKYLKKGGPLKSNEMAIVGEAGPELLIPSGAGGFNVLPNKDLRQLYNGTIGLSSYARNVTNEAQPDAHDYTDPTTGEIWPSVTKIQRLGKESNYGSTYYSDVGSVAHYHAAQALGAQHGIDVSHVTYPEITGASETNRAKTYHSAEQIAEEGRILGEAFVKLANEVGFIPTMIEERFVNTRGKYSGTVDMAGNMRDETGNMVPAIADFKTGSKFEPAKFAEQLGGYAQFFSNQVGGLIINVTRDMSRMEAVPVDIIKGADSFREKLDKYNTIHGPRPMSAGMSASMADPDYLWKTFGAEIAGSAPTGSSKLPGYVDYKDDRSHLTPEEDYENYEKFGIPVMPGQTSEESQKVSGGVTENPYGIHMQKGKPTVNLCDPTMKAIKAMFISQTKSITAAIVNITTNNNSGGGGGGGGKPKSPIPTLTYVGGIMGALEKAPIIGAPIAAKRRWNEAHNAIDEFHAQGTGSYDEYIKLLQKEEMARGKYYRSIRGATTSFLIAQHVMRIFGQTSQVVNKSSEAVGKGLGYILDMFLLPVLPVLSPIVNGLLAVGNAIRIMNGMLSGFAAPVFLLGLGLLAKMGWGIVQTVRSMGDLPQIMDRLSNALTGLNNTISTLIQGINITGSNFPLPPSFKNPNQYSTPIGPKKPGFRQKLWTTLGFDNGIDYVPGDGGKDTTLARLTRGEMVLPVHVAKKIRGYADGGIVGGMSSLMGGITGAYGSLVSSDAGSAVITGLGMVSKTVGAMMAPLAPVIAGGALAGKGISMVRNSIDRMRASNESITGGGFSSLRTMAAAQLVSMIGGLAPLLPIGAAILGIYAWTQGFGGIAEGLLRGIHGFLGFIKDAMKGIWDFLKDRFKIEVKTDPVKDPKRDTKLSDEKLIEAEKERRRRAKEELDRKNQGETDEEKRAREQRERDGKPKPEPKPTGILDRFPLFKGVAEMTGLGGIIGAMESKDPIEWVKSAAMGGGAQFALNWLTSKAPMLGKGVGGFLGLDFGKQVADAVTEGEGPLSPAQYSPMIKDNQLLNNLIRVGISGAMSTTQGLSGVAGGALADLVGGIGSPGDAAKNIAPTGLFKLLAGQGFDGLIGDVGKSKQSGDYLGGEYGLFGTFFAGVYDTMLKNNPQVVDGVGSTSVSNTTPVVAKLEEINKNLDRPSIYNINITSTADADTIARMIDHKFASTSRTAGTQVTF